MKLLMHKSFFVEMEVCLHILCGQASGTQRKFETEITLSGFCDHFYIKLCWNDCELPDLLEELFEKKRIR